MLLTIASVMRKRSITSKKSWKLRSKISSANIDSVAHKSTCQARCKGGGSTGN